MSEIDYVLMSRTDSALVTSFDILKVYVETTDHFGLRVAVENDFFNLPAAAAVTKSKESTGFTYNIKWLLDDENKAKLVKETGALFSGWKVSRPKDYDRWLINYSEAVDKVVPKVPRAVAGSHKRSTSWWEAGGSGREVKRLRSVYKAVINDSTIGQSH